MLWDEEVIESSAGKKLSDLMMLNNLDQLIDEPTKYQSLIQGKTPTKWY